MADNFGGWGIPAQLTISDLLKIARTGLGTTSSDGIILENSTPAAAGAQQISPRTRWSGRGWKTDAAAGSQQVDYIAQLVPVQGAAAPQARLDFNYAINAGVLQATPTMSLLNDKVGIGTTTAEATLDIQHADTNLSYFNGQGLKIRSGGDSTGIVGWSRHGVESYLGSEVDDVASYFVIGARMASSTNRTYSIVIRGSGNIGLNLTDVGTSAVKVLGMASGTAPTTSLADMAHLWVGDVNAEAGKASFMMRSEITANGNGAVVGAFIKTTTGSFAAGYEGMIEINTFDNVARIWADGAWRTIASGW